MADLFGKRWLREYLPELQMRQKCSRVSHNFVPGDIVTPATPPLLFVLSLFHFAGCCSRTCNNTRCRVALSLCPPGVVAETLRPAFVWRRCLCQSVSMVLSVERMQSRVETTQDLFTKCASKRGVLHCESHRGDSFVSSQDGKIAWQTRFFEEKNIKKKLFCPS